MKLILDGQQIKRYDLQNADFYFLIYIQQEAVLLDVYWLSAAQGAGPTVTETDCIPSHLRFHRLI